jgi:hypothetical protein
MRTRIKSKFSLLFVAFAALLAVPAIALADNISNTLDPTVDAVAETMPLTVGGANGTTKLYVDPTNGDGKNGCNLTGSTSLTISLASNNTGVATVSPSTVTFTSCLNSTNGIPITVTPHNQGAATISATQVSNNTGASFDLNPVRFNVAVLPPPNTPPQVTVAGVTGGASYPKGFVPPATCNVTDAEDGNSSFPATLSAVTGPFASDGIGSQTASCSYTDAGGATAAASLSYSIVDPSAPVITYQVQGTQGDNGWYTSDVTLTWSVTDPQSPNSLAKTGCVNQSIITDQAATTYTCSATSAGGPAGPISVTIKRDATNPSVTATPDRGADLNGWYNHAVTVSFSGQDAMSGIASCDAAVSYNGPDGTGKNVSGSCTDKAGNSASDTFGPFKYDATDPTNVSASPNRAADSNGWYNHAVGFTFTGTDVTSGIASCSTATYNGPDGTGKTVSGSCTDNAGNSANGASSAIDYDATDPTNVSGALARAADHNGWYNAPVGYQFSGQDATSGIAANGCSSGTYSGPDGIGRTINGSCTDRAGNSAQGATSAFKYDATKPTLNPAVSPNPVLLNATATATANASDNLSGVASASCGSVDTSSVGSKSVTCTATDDAGNTNSANASYSVIYKFDGFRQPVDNPGTGATPVFNSAKAGQSIPIKFSLFGNQGLGIIAAGYPKVTSVACPNSTATVDAIEEYATTTANNGLTYDATADQYNYVWKTQSTYANKCFKFDMTLIDGTPHVAYFRFLK